MRGLSVEGRQLPNWAIGLITIAIVLLGSVIAMSKLLGVRMPWQGGFEVQAVFSSAQTLQRSYQVRIAGVQVGEVTEVEPLGGTDDDLRGALVTMSLTDDAGPIHEDATFQLRPRLFLDGNLFVELRPGSPPADVVDEGHTFPVTQTSNSVQLDQVLTTLQADVRGNLQTLLDELGDGLVRHGGATGLREYFASSAPANRYSAEVGEGLLGTEEGDLSGFIKGLDRVVAGLGRDDESLQGFVTNLRTFSGSLAAQDAALGEAIERLPGALRAGEPAFTALDSAFPSLRAFAREALPGVRSTASSLRPAIPFARQLRGLMSRPETRGLVADLRPTIPDLARLVDRTGPFLTQTRALSSCFNEVFIPWSNDSVKPVDPTGTYPHGPAGRVFEETGYTLTGLTGIARNSDANGNYARVLGGGGPNIVEFPAFDGEPDKFGLIPFPLLGAMPTLEDSERSPFRPDVPCERQEPPNLEGTLGNAPPQSPAPTGGRR